MTVLMPIVFLAVSLAFIIAVERFVSLDIVAEDGQENSFELIGPRISGKTYSTFALYRAVDKEDEFKFTFTNNEMGSLLDKNPEEMEEGASFDAIENNSLRDNDEYEFHFLKETGIPEKFQVRTRDYAGELLPDIADRLAQPMTDGGQEEEDEGNEDASDPSDTDETDGDTDGLNVDGITIDSEETESETSGLDPEDMEQETDDLIKDVRDRVNSQGDSEGSEADPQREDEHQPEDSQEADETSENPSESTEDRDTEEAQTEESGFDADPESSASDPEDEDTSEDSATTGPGSEKSGFDERSGSTQSDGAEVKSRKEIVKEVSKNVEKSDKLVMLLDTERFLDELPNPSEYNMQTNNMRRIAESCNPDEIILMATKADYFVPQWQEDENYESKPTTDNQERWKNFSDYVSDEFNDNVAISAFMDEVNASRVYPVFFHTDEENDLTLDNDGNIRTEGYDRVLKALTR